MRSRTTIILFSLTAVLLFASMIQQATEFCKVKPLIGASYAKPKPTFTFQNYRNGSLQTATESYLQQHYGFREPLTRFYNQIVWALFRSSKVVDDQRILITPDNWIFEPWSVEEYYQSRIYLYAKDSADMVKRMEAEAHRIYQLQHMLEPYGTHLFVALLPGKEQICSEHMPKNTCYFKEKKITAMEYYSRRFEELKVPNVNFSHWFMQIKDTVSYPLFPQTGTHWSNLASTHVADSLLCYMEQLGDMNLLNLKILYTYRHTVKPDNDLEGLMNLIWPIRKAPNYLAGYTYPPDSTAVKPKLITIGDSFYWNLLSHSYFGTPFRAYPYWYYFNTAYFNNDKNNVSEIDLLDEVLSADFIMLSYSTATIYGMSNGFSERLLLEMCYEPEEINNKLGQVRHAIESDSLRQKEIFNHAIHKGKTYEQELKSEVNYTIFSDLKHYFPALCDSIPTQRSLKARYLTGDSLAFVEWETRSTAQKIKNDPEKMERIRQQALDRGMDIESMTYYNARWIVEQRIKEGKLVYPGKPKTNPKVTSYGIQ
jgi:hypothetical protein